LRLVLCVLFVVFVACLCVYVFGLELSCLAVSD